MGGGVILLWCEAIYRVRRPSPRRNILGGLHHKISSAVIDRDLLDGLKTSLAI
jgi:hypothetical protein